MKKSFIAASLALAAVTLAPLAAQAQNVAVVNGKPVPKARVDTIVSQVQKQAAARNQQVPPDLEKLVRDKVVTDEILSQEAERRGLGATPDFKAQMEKINSPIVYMDAPEFRKYWETDAKRLAAVVKVVGKVEVKPAPKK